ncbi:hypothetical protein E4U13_002163 [Claviceps humidiphila]|uniref:Required for respiratory growth protein 9, mitochondrial n=1 Tax=Claviceps humidiphila TaxID=1294629 RepID=A0A9P7Q1F1_9HYPO|nr:hypothetical protein E4U13_002163 [Claviceps humidiphila]
MKCACSSAPWRKFLQGLVQVHNAPAVAAKPRFSTLSTACRAAPRLTTTSARFFGTTGARGQEASAAAAAVVEGEVSGDTAATATSAANTIQTTPEEIRTATKSTQKTSGRDETRIGNASTTETSATKDTSPGSRRPTETRKRNKTFASANPPRETKQPHFSSSSTSPPSIESTPPTNTRTHDPFKPRSRNISYDKDSSSTAPAPPTQDDEKPQRAKERWQIQKEALKEKFPDGWAPRKRLSPDALAGIRALNAQFPEVYTTKTLADKFQVSPEAIRRVLKSKWMPSAEEEQDRQERWFRRGKQVWERQAALGIKPPKKWRVEGIVRDKEWYERRKRAVKWEQEWEEKEKAMELERRARAKAREAGTAWGGGGGQR